MLRAAADASGQERRALRFGTGMEGSSRHQQFTSTRKYAKSSKGPIAKAAASHSTTSAGVQRFGRKGVEFIRLEKRENPDLKPIQVQGIPRFLAQLKLQVTAEQV